MQIVKNMEGQQGPVVNQFIITLGKLEIFQSYESVIVVRDNKIPKVYLDKNLWDYSNTTSKYRAIFLSETTQRTRKKIKDGLYIAIDLNTSYTGLEELSFTGQLMKLAAAAGVSTCANTPL